MKDIPNNSSFQFSYLVPFEVEKMIGKPIDGYAGDMFFTYFVLDSPKSAEIINLDITEFLESKYEETLVVNQYLSHIRQVYLYGETNAFWGIFIFGMVGMGILLIAIINYVNLSTAKSIDRAKEVGIRKTGGAERWQLIRQFLAESMLTTLAAVNLAILMVESILPYFNNSFDAQLIIPYQAPAFWLFIIAMVLIVGFMVGYYPAFMLSSFKPSLILKNFQGG